MPKHGALIAFGLLTQRREDTTPKDLPRLDLRDEETSRVMPATGRPTVDLPRRSKHR
jgi:hypothetical protein